MPLTQSFKLAAREPGVTFSNVLWPFNDLLVIGATAKKTIARATQEFKRRLYTIVSSLYSIQSGIISVGIVNSQTSFWGSVEEAAFDLSDRIGESNFYGNIPGKNTVKPLLNFQSLNLQ